MTASRSEPLFDQDRPLLDSVTALSRIISRITSKELSVCEIPEELRRLAKWLEDERGVKGIPKHNRVQELRETATRIISYWRQVCGHPGAAATDARVSTVVARLREGYTEEQLKRAVDAISVSPFHQGENEAKRKFDTIELIFRKSKIDGYIQMAESTVVATSPSGQSSADAMRALRAGDVAEYNRINAAMKRGE